MSFKKSLVLFCVCGNKLECRMRGDEQQLEIKPCEDCLKQKYFEGREEGVRDAE